jgi:hypothetical protein
MGELLTFRPKTPHDSFDANGIFGGILADVVATARAINIDVRRPLVLATSTDVAPTPAARPTDGTHMIFAGPGLSMFCNYWGKVVARIATALGHLDSPAATPTTRGEIERTARIDPSAVLLATKLAPSTTRAARRSSVSEWWKTSQRSAASGGSWCVPWSCSPSHTGTDTACLRNVRPRSPAGRSRRRTSASSSRATPSAERSLCTGVRACRTGRRSPARRLSSSCGRVNFAPRSRASSARVRSRSGRRAIPRPPAHPTNR